MKGYAVESGYMGYVDGTYMLFASETDYADYMADQWAQFKRRDILTRIFSVDRMQGIQYNTMGTEHICGRPNIGIRQCIDCK